MDAATEEELKQTREVVKNMQVLVDSPAWQFYKDMLKRQEDNRRFTPASSQDGFGALLQRDFINGEIQGLMLAQHLAEQALESGLQVLSEYAEEKGDE